MDRADPVICQVEERRRPDQVFTDGKLGSRSKLRKFLFASFGENFDPAEITLALQGPGRNLFFKLNAPRFTACCRNNRLYIDLHPKQQADELVDAGRRSLQLRQAVIEAMNAEAGSFFLYNGRFQDFTGVSKACKSPAIKERLMNKIVQPLFKRPQGAKQVAAVYC